MKNKQKEWHLATKTLNLYFSEVNSDLGKIALKFTSTKYLCERCKLYSHMLSKSMQNLM
jgi:hypothetical protein